MRILIGNRVATVSTSTTLDSASEPIGSVLLGKPSYTVISADNVLNIHLETTDNISTDIFCTNTNADTAEITLRPLGSAPGPDDFTTTIDVEYPRSLSDWMDDYIRQLQRKSFWVEYTPIFEAAEIDVVLTSAAGTKCFAGPIRVDNALVIAEPNSGLNRIPVLNDVAIRLEGGEIYRRRRFTQVQYSGELSLHDNKDAIIVLQSINELVGAEPIAFKIIDCAYETRIFGSLETSGREFVGYNSDRFSFTITEEV